MNASNPEAPDRNLAVEPVRVTKPAALAAGQRIGRDQEKEGDDAIVDTMCQLVSTVAINSVVIISEDEKNKVPMLFGDEKVDNDQGPAIDTAVDPVDGITLVVEGRPNSIAVLAAADRGPMCGPSVMFYMDKIAVSPEAAGKIDTEASIEHNIKVVAEAEGLCPGDVTVVALDRPRHADTIRDIREAGARVRLTDDGDAAGTVAVVQNTNSVDIMMGVGGIPEGVITACAMKCMNGEIQSKLHPHDKIKIKKTLDAGRDPSRVLAIDNLIAFDSCYFVVTGATNGNMLRGVAYRGNGAWTHSLVARSRSGTIRRIEALRSLEKLCKYASIGYGKDKVPDVDL